MKTGGIEGFVDRTWQVVHDSGELAAAVTSYTISGLDGDTDVKYRLISRVVNGYNGHSLQWRIFLNNDSTSGNYGYQQVVGTNATVSAARATGTGFISVFANGALNDLSFTDTIINAKSGTVRTAISKTATRINGTAIEDILLVGNSWNNTVDNLTSIVINAGVASGIGIGSRFILLKEVHIPSGLRTGELDIRGTLKGAWQEVYRTTLEAPATSIAVTGLLGNTKDQILRVRCRLINAYNGALSVGMYLNGDQTANHYGYQYVQGVNTTASAGRSATETKLDFLNASALNQIAHAEMLLYVKSGFIRTAIHEKVSAVSGTTVDGVTLFGQSWVNTADELTELSLTASQANALGIGTELVVERLNL